MLHYNLNDIEILEEMHDLINGFKVEVGDDEVWAVARESQEIPSPENILMKMTFSRLAEAIREKYGKDFNLPEDFIAYDVNLGFSSFSVGGEEVYTRDEVEEIISKRFVLQHVSLLNLLDDFDIGLDSWNMDETRDYMDDMSNAGNGFKNVQEAYLHLILYTLKGKIREAFPEHADEMIFTTSKTDPVLSVNGSPVYSYEDIEDALKQNQDVQR